MIRLGVQLTLVVLQVLAAFQETTYKMADDAKKVNYHLAHYQKPDGAEAMGSYNEVNCLQFYSP